LTGLPTYLVDANLILRFLLNDHPEHSSAVKRLVARARKREVSLEVPFVALTETVFTLKSFYKKDRQDIAREMTKILTTPGIKFRGPTWVFDAIEELGMRNVSFGDACLAAEARVDKLPVASFDRDFDGLDGVTRFEPK